MISVLMPVRNGMPFLRDAVDSVLAQSYRDFELIVIDDGSFDGSAEFVRYQQDDRVRLITSPGAGIAAALNAGISASTRPFIARHDADDMSHRDRLVKQLAFLQSRHDVGVVTSRVQFVNQDGREIDTQWTRAVTREWEGAMTPRAIASLMPQTCCIVHGSVMARRGLLLAHGGYDESLPVAQDYDLWLRLLPHTRFARLPDALYTFRLHDGQVSASRGRDQARHAISAKLRYLQSTAGVPTNAHARIVGSGDGVELYRQAMNDAGWTESSGALGDVTIFTDFATIEPDMRSVMALAHHPQVRIGNFLVPAGISA